MGGTMTWLSSNMGQLITGQGLEAPKRSIDSLAILEKNTKAFFCPVLLVQSVNPISVLYVGDGTVRHCVSSKRRHQHVLA